MGNYKSWILSWKNKNKNSLILYYWLWILATVLALRVLACFLKSVQLREILGWIYLFGGDAVIVLLVGVCWGHSTHTTETHAHSHASVHELATMIIPTLAVSSARMLPFHPPESRIKHLLAALWREKKVVVIHVISLILLMRHVGYVGGSSLNLIFDELMILVSNFSTGAFVWIDAWGPTTVPEATKSNATLLLWYLVLKILELLELAVLRAVGSHRARVLAEMLATTAMVHHPTGFWATELGLVHILLILRLIVTTQ